MRRRAVVVAQSFGGLFEMPRDNFHERIEVDGRGAVEAVVVVQGEMPRGEVPAVGEGFFVRRLVPERYFRRGFQIKCLNRSSPTNPFGLPLLP